MWQIGHNTDGNLSDDLREINFIAPGHPEKVKEQTTREIPFEWWLAMKPGQNRAARSLSGAIRPGARCGLLLLTSFTLSASDLPWRRHTIDSSFVGADGVRLADINGDGLVDITTGWEESGRIRVYLNPGHSKSREPWPAVTVGEVASPEDAVFVDLDGDGATDVVSSCEGQTRTMFVHWAPKDRGRLLDPAVWRTEAIPATAGRQMWMFAIPLQVDGRHGLDLVVGSKGDEGSVSWLESPANPRDLAAWKLHLIRHAGWIMSLIAQDLDGDGDRDVLLSDRKGRRSRVFWLEHPGATVSAHAHPWREHPIGAPSEEVMFIDFADMNGDGRKDVIAAAKPHKVFFLEQPPSPSADWIQRVVELPGNTGGAKAVRAADIDLDGRADLVFSCEGAADAKSGVSWFKAGGETDRETWAQHDIAGAEGEKFDLIELLDLDGDGDLDVITCEEKDKLGVIWYENPIRNGPPNTKASR